MPYKKLRFTDEQIQIANSINILEYAKQHFDVKRVGTNSYKIEGYGGLHINPVTNKWNCFSQGEGGGPIQFIMFTENKSWVESVKTLLGSNYESKNIQTFDKVIQKESYKYFILPKKNKTFNHVIAYLIKTRRIDKDVVYKFINNKMLYEDENRNCVFVGYDKEGIPRYANLRSSNTNITFKGEVRNSNKAYSFSLSNKDSDTVYVFESPIELMSYMSLKNKFNHNAVSLGGIYDMALNQFLSENKNIKSIHLCLNNDDAGKTGTKLIVEKYKKDYDIEVEYPSLKDFNEELMILKKFTKGNSYEEEIEEELEI